MRAQRTIVYGLFAGALLCSVPRAAFAEDPKPAADSGTPDERASRYLSQGNKAFKDGRFADAEKAYRAAFDLKKVYDIAGNLAMAEFAQNKTREAAEHLAFALRLFPVTGEPAQREQMQKTFDQCKGTVGALHVDVSPSGAEVRVDGKAVGVSPLLDDVYVPVGAHTVEARLDKYEDAKKDNVRAEKGAVTPLTLVLKEKPPEVVVKREKEQVYVTAPKRSVVPAIVMGGVAVVVAGVGGALFAVGSGKQSDATAVADGLRKNNQHCPADANTTVATCKSLFDGLKSADSLHNAAIGMFVGAAVVGAAAVTYLLLPAPAAKKAAALPVKAIPVAGAGQGGLWVSGSF